MNNCVTEIIFRLVSPRRKKNTLKPVMSIQVYTCRDRNMHASNRVARERRRPVPQSRPKASSELVAHSTKQRNHADKHIRHQLEQSTRGCLTTQMLSQSIARFIDYFP